MARVLPTCHLRGWKAGDRQGTNEASNVAGLGQIAFGCEGGIDTCTAAQNTLAVFFDLGPKVGSVGRNLKSNSGRFILEPMPRDSAPAWYAIIRDFDADVPWRLKAFHTAAGLAIEPSVRSVYEGFAVLLTTGQSRIDRTPSVSLPIGSSLETEAITAIHAPKWRG